MKICNICKKNKALTKFNKGLDKYGKKHYCKKCSHDLYYVKYIEKEETFVPQLYTSLLSRWRKIQKRKDITDEGKKQYKVKITKPQFLKLWEEHKKKHGLKCCMTQINFTFKRGNRRKTSNKNNHNVSVDRLDNSQGYTSKNIVFVVYAFNDRKCSITILDCVNILRHYKERFPNTNTCKIIELYEKIGNLQSREKYKKELTEKGILH